MKIKGRADAQQCRGAQTAHVGCHPPFLLPGAEADPHEIRGSGVDPVDDRGLFFRCDAAERWTERTGDLQTGIKVREALGETGGNPFAAAQKKVSEPGLPAPIAEVQHEGGPGETFNVAVSEEPRCHGDADAIRHREV